MGVDFLENYSIIIPSKDDFEKSKKALLNESRKFLLELQADNKCISHLEYFNERADLFTKQNKLYVLNSFYLDKNDTSIPLRVISDFNFKSENARNLIEYYLVQGYKILLVAQDDTQKTKITRILEEIKEEYTLADDFSISENTRVSLMVKDFAFSYEFTKEKFVVLSSKDIFKEKNHLSTYSTKFKEGKIIDIISKNPQSDGDIACVGELFEGKEKMIVIHVCGDANIGDKFHIAQIGNDKIYAVID